MATHNGTAMETAPNANAPKVPTAARHVVAAAQPCHLWMNSPRGNAARASSFTKATLGCCSRNF
ncbi:MAG: hypothetical protein DYG96_09615 [Chlorobi bacterium CHB2]|nr:hypothetical protein [Chlorobi bacterium CHB2]